MKRGPAAPPYPPSCPPWVNGCGIAKCDEDGRYRVWVTVTMIVFVNPAADTEVESVGVRRVDLDVVSWISS